MIVAFCAEPPVGQLIGGPASHAHQRCSVLSVEGSPLAGGIGMEPIGIEPIGMEPIGMEPIGEFCRSIDPIGTAFRRGAAVAFASTCDNVMLCNGCVASGVPARMPVQLDGGSSGIVESAAEPSSVWFVVRPIEPIGMEPIGIEPIGIEPIGIEPIGIEPIGAELTPKTVPISADSGTFASCTCAAPAWTLVALPAVASVIEPVGAAGTV